MPPRNSPSDEGAAIAVDPWLQHLERHLPLAEEGADPEGVHQVRVSLGRLRVWLQLAERCVLDDDLAWLRGRAGEVRDLDVLLGESPPASWADWLNERRDLARVSWLEALAQPRVEALLESLGCLPELDPRLARQGVERLLQQVRRRGKRALARPDDILALHDLRRALRRLRYALDWLDRRAPVVRELQSAFGLVNDLAVRLHWLQRFPLGEQLSDFVERAQQELSTARVDALSLWRERRSEVHGLGHELWSASA